MGCLFFHSKMVTKNLNSSNLCDYNDAYILVRGEITIIGHNVIQLAFKNCAPFTKHVTKIDGITIDHA